MLPEVGWLPGPGSLVEMAETLFTRSTANPILTAGTHWWEARAVLNPGATVVEGRVALVYRAVGADGLSRLGLAWSSDGEHIDERRETPLYEGALDDPYARLGIEDPRITALDRRYYLTYCKASVETGDQQPLSWEPAPFRVRSGIAVSDVLRSVREVGVLLPGENSKDAVLFPQRIAGRYAALIRVFPAIQYTTSIDLLHWSDPVTVMEPVPDTWQGERIGAGPPPIRTDRGWLLLYHGNQYLHLPDNHRRYSMGLALLDIEDPTRVVYRHPEPVFQPEAPYEVEGPVGNVVFATGIAELGERLYLYYGAGDGVIGVAWTDRTRLERFLSDALAR